MHRSTMLSLPRLVRRGLAWPGSSPWVSVMLSSPPAEEQIVREPSDQFQYLKDRTPQENFFNQDNFKTKSKLWSECRKALRDPTALSKNHVLNNIKLCASSTLLEAPEVRVQLADDIWKELRKSGMVPDAAVYNILLRVYAANDHAYVPSEFLEMMKEDNVSPNLGTFRYLIGMYCDQGNMGGASKLLHYMQKVGMPLSEAVYASLVTGHARAGSMEDAEKVLVTMRTNQHAPHNVVYTSLLCAYAERKQMEDVHKVFDRMYSERLFPSLVTYIHVMNTLSKFGHGALVPQIIYRLKNKHWLSSDLRVLCCNCLSRGELTAPRIFLTELFQCDSLTPRVLEYYMAKCLAAGHTIMQITDDLKKDLDLQQYPMFYRSVVAEILFCIRATRLNDTDDRRYPDRGDLAAHPWGDRWTQLLREALHEVKQEVKDDVQCFYFYPLLARHCSDADLEGLEVTLLQMIEDLSFPFTAIVVDYVNKAFSNAGTTFDEYYNSQQVVDGPDKSRKMMFPLLYKCCIANFSATLQLVEKIEDVEILKTQSDTLIKALKLGFLKSTLLVGTQPGQRMFSPVALFQALEDKGVDVPPVTYLKFVRFLDNPSLLSKVFHSFIAKEKLFRTEDYVEIFRVGLDLNEFEVVKRLHDTLPAAVTEDSGIRSQYILCLFAMKNWNRAIQTLNSMLEEGLKPIPKVWARLIPFTYKRDPIIGEDLLSKMRHYGFKPSAELRHKLLRVYVYKDNVEKAEEGLRELENDHLANSQTYEMMLDLWASRGNIEKIKEMCDAKIFPSEGQEMHRANVKALLVNRQFDEALQCLENKPTLSRGLLIFMLRAYVRLNRPLEPLLSTIAKCGFMADYVHTLLFFVYADYEKHVEASAILKNLKQLDAMEVKINMKKSQAFLYMKLMKLNNHLLVPVTSTLEPEQGSVHSAGEDTAVPEQGVSVEDLSGKLIKTET